LRDRLQKEGRIAETGWENYTKHDVNFVPKKMTKEELERGIVSVYQRINDRDAIRKKMEYFTSILSKLQE
jgi:hypothetical protein